MNSVLLTVTRRQAASNYSSLPASRQRPASHALANERTLPATAYAHDFSRVRVSAAPRGNPQARLPVGQPGDPFEREADLIADRIMQYSLPEGARPHAERPKSPNLPSNDAWAESIQRTPDEAEEQTHGNQPSPEQAAARDDVEAAKPGGAEEAPGDGVEQVAAMLLEEDDLEASQTSQAPAEELGGAGGGSVVQAREMSGQTPTVSPRQEAAVNALRGRGAPLTAVSRAFFEPRFGHDFRHVRIHTGVEASRMARGFRARAFTLGSEVVFGAGQYQPETPAGRWLMAHELTHVLQQQTSTGGVAVHHTGHDQVQGGFFDRLWRGIKKGAAAAAGAVRWTAGKAWEGIRWAAGKLWKGVKAIGRWGWDVLKSGAALAWSYVVNTPGRIRRLIKHLGSGIAGVASSLWQGLKLALKLDFKGLCKLLLDGILSGTAWALRLFAKLIDVAGIGEIVDLLSQIIKFNTRSLSSGESSEAHKVFKNSISYWKVRIDEHSLISKIGAWFKGSSGLGVTLFHTVNFNHKITAAPGSLDMRWLAHELTHVSQYEHAGAQYIGEAVHAQATAGYDYHGPGALWRPSTHVAPNTLGRHFREFNREQQADIAADYYYSLYHNLQPQHGFPLVTGDYEPVVDELRNGNL